MDDVLGQYKDNLQAASFDQSWGLGRPRTLRSSGRHGRSVAQVVFRFALDTGMVALTGTTDAGHMREDLEVFAFRLEPEEAERIERLAAT